MIEEIDAELIDAMFSDATEYLCTCNTSEHCSFCSKWTKAVKAVERLVSERDRLRAINAESVETCRTAKRLLDDHLTNTHKVNIRKAGAILADIIEQATGQSAEGKDD